MRSFACFCGYALVQSQLHVRIECVATQYDVSCIQGAIRRLHYDGRRHIPWPKRESEVCVKQPGAHARSERNDAN